MYLRFFIFYYYYDVGVGGGGCHCLTKVFPTCCSRLFLLTNNTPSLRNGGSSATSLTAVPAHCLSVPSARLPIQRRNIASLTLPALRVATFNRSSPAAHPRWPAVLTAKKSTLPAAGIAPPAQKPLQTHQECYLDRRRTAWSSLKTRLALQRSLVQY